MMIIRILGSALMSLFVCLSVWIILTGIAAFTAWDSALMYNVSEWHNVPRFFMGILQIIVFGISMSIFMDTCEKE